MTFEKKVLLAICAVAFSLGIAACTLTDRAGLTTLVETTDATTGETVTTRELSPEAETVIEETTSAASKSGGLLGILGVAAGAAFGIYKNRKEKTALKTASAVVEGVSEVLAKVDEVNAAGESATQITSSDIKALLKTVQEDAGVREAVQNLLKKQQSTTVS